MRKETTLYFLNSTGVKTSKELMAALAWLQAHEAPVEQLVFADECEEMALALADGQTWTADAITTMVADEAFDWHLAGLGALLQVLVNGDFGKVVVLAPATMLSALMKMVMSSGSAFAGQASHFFFAPAGFSKVRYEHDLAEWSLDFHNQAVEERLFARVADVPVTATHLFTFVRHGESEGNVMRIFQGIADYPLTPKGVRQAEHAREMFVREEMAFDQFFCSPLTRAKDTAEIVVSGLDGVRLVPLKTLLEVDNGEIAGIKIEEWLAHKPSVPEDRFVKIGQTGESWWELYWRAGAFLHTLVTGPSGHVGCVTHGGLLRSIFKQVMGVPGLGNQQAQMWLVNGAVHQVAYDAGEGRWHLLNVNGMRMVLDED